MHRIYFLFSLLICLGLVLAACQPPAAPAPTATAVPTAVPVPTVTLTPGPLVPFPDRINLPVEINGRKYTLNCEGTGPVTILLENGLDILSWNAPQYSKIGRTCVIVRPGVMVSISLGGPRTSMDQVKDLHTLLKQIGVPAPYILVGHSIAGYNLLIFTDTYPEEVVGLVCVDCRYPAVADLFLEKVKINFSKEVNPEEAALKFYGSSPYTYEVVKDPNAWHSNKEEVDIYTSAQRVRQVKSLGNRPFVVLVAEITESEQKVDLLMLEAWKEAAVKLSQLSTQARLETVPKKSHFTILRDPAVERAIQEVYDKVK